MKSFKRKWPSEGDAEQEEANLAQRVALLEALCAALDRRHEVLELLEAASDPDSALKSLEDMLGLEPWAASAVLDLQLGRLTTNQRERTAAELAEANARLRKVRQEPRN